MLGLMQDWPLRLHRILDHAATQFGTQEIVSRLGDGRLARTTYAGLREHARAIGERLAREGIGAGDRVATLAWNSATHMAVWYGAAGIGAVYHTVNPRLFPDQIAWIVRHAADRVIVADSGFLPLLEQLAPQWPALERVIVMSEGEGPPSAALPGAAWFSEWAGDTPLDPSFAWAALDERAAAGLCYTSGTTGEPKGVLYSHRSTVLHAMMVCGIDIMALGAHDTVMPVVPMFHVNAWGIPFAAPMVGARLVMPGNRLDGASLFSLMDEEGVTMSAGVPTIWAGLLDHMRATGRKPGRLARLLVGGSACPRSMIEAFDAEFGIEVRHAWGMTETSPVASTGLPKPGVAGADRMAARARQGSAPFGVEMRIVDDDGADLPWDGEVFGRLLVRGFAVTAGYYGDEAPVLDEQGFFDTGDIATIDPRGCMTIVDRSKDVIKSGGEWISSIAIETLASAHPAIAQAAVIGIACERWGERPLLVVVPRAGWEVPSHAAMLAFLAPNMARWALPDDTQPVAELPLTATGKVSKRLLRARFADYRLPPRAR